MTEERASWRRRLAHLLTLGENWDRMGAAAVSPAAVDLAGRVLDGLEDALLPYGIVPDGQDGGVCLEWHPYGCDVEVDCKPDGRLEGTWMLGVRVVQEYAAPDVAAMQAWIAHALAVGRELVEERRVLEGHARALREDVERLTSALLAARRVIRAHHESGEAVRDGLCPVCVVGTTDHGYQYQPDREMVELALGLPAARAGRGGG